MSSNTDELTLGSELARKVFDEMAKVWAAYLSGRATHSQTKARVETIWNIASGLISDPEFVTSLEYMSGALEAVAKRYECQGAELMLFESPAGKMVLTVRRPGQDDPTQMQIIAIHRQGETSWSTEPGSGFREAHTAWLDKLDVRGFEMIAFN